MSFFPERVVTTVDKSCPYIDGNKSTTKHYIDFVDAQTYQELLLRGWRRFGRHFFIPSCDQCSECVSVRVVVEQFELSRSFKRIIKANKDTKLAIRKPIVTEEHLTLYSKYHHFRSETRGWDEDDSDVMDYHSAFVDGANDYGYEFAYYVGNKLVAVALVDVLPMGVSAVYCYYDPDFAHLSLGTYSILKQIEIAKKMGISHLYLGYNVAQNSSLSYKSRFRPFEVLKGRPTINEEAIWIRGEDGED